jgi:hypothetical protein
MSAAKSSVQREPFLNVELVVEENDPDEPPVAETLKPLGSLAQAARGNELNSAQRILLVIGILTLAINGFLLFNLPNEIQHAIEQNQIAPEDVEQARQGGMIAGYLMYGLTTLLGVVFVIFGLVVKQFPLPITITSLVLYVFAIAGLGFLDRETLVHGIIMKVIIVFALIRAIKAARAYQDHTSNSIGAEGQPG